MRDALPPYVAPRGARAAFRLTPTVFLSKQDTLPPRRSLLPVLRGCGCYAPATGPKDSKALPPQPCSLGSRACSLRLAPSESAAHQLLGRRRSRPRGVRACPGFPSWNTCTCLFPSALALLLEQPSARQEKKRSSRRRSAAWFSVAADTCSRSRDERWTRRGRKQLSSIPCALTRVLLGPASTRPALTCLLTNTLCLSFSSQHPEERGAATLPEPQRAAERRSAAQGRLQRHC